jgi:hypothetical protein
VPLPLLVKLTPAGRVPLRVMVVEELAAVVMAKLSAVPAFAAAVAALVKAGTVPVLPAAFTVTVIVWLAVPALLAAVTVTASVPAVTAVLPDSVPVPLPLAVKVSPAGSVPAVSVAVGWPVAATV